MSDQDIVDYIQNISQEVEEVSPFAIDKGTGNYSDQFSFIDSEEDTVTKGYTYLGANHHIPIVNDESSDNNKSKFDAGSFEKYLSSRDAEIKKILGNGNPAMRI